MAIYWYCVLCDEYFCCEDRCHSEHWDFVAPVDPNSMHVRECEAHDCQTVD